MSSAHERYLTLLQSRLLLLEELYLLKYDCLESEDDKKEWKFIFDTLIDIYESFENETLEGEEAMEAHNRLREEFRVVEAYFVYLADIDSDLKCGARIGYPGSRVRHTLKEYIELDEFYSGMTIIPLHYSPPELDPQ